jgi:hypothetical protein
MWPCDECLRSRTVLTYNRHYAEGSSQTDPTGSPFLFAPSLTENASIITCINWVDQSPNTVVLIGQSGEILTPFQAECQTIHQHDSNVNLMDSKARCHQANRLVRITLVQSVSKNFGPGCPGLRHRRTSNNYKHSRSLASFPLRIVGKFEARHDSKRRFDEMMTVFGWQKVGAVWWADQDGSNKWGGTNNILVIQLKK